MTDPELYPKPPWCHMPTHAWALVEVKNGIEVAKHRLLDACTVLGRAADMVQVELAHESCSRQHARIAFDSRGVPWLRDLQSSHGTTVNKKSIPAIAIGKTESTSTKLGSRGVVLFPGDVLQFGASTRLFYVQGPEQFERGAMMELQQQPQLQPNAQMVSLHALHSRDADDEPEQTHTLDDNSIPVQHYKAWEALKAKRYKLQNLQIENERIEQKGELTVGQQRQLERNMERIITLSEEINVMEKDLLNKVFPGSKAGPQSLFTAAFDEDDVDDRVDDGRLSERTEVETEESLVAEWKNCFIQVTNQKLEIAAVEANLRTLQEKIIHAADEEERFFLQNDVNLAEDAVKKSKGQLHSIFSNLNQTEKLLRVVNNKIVTDFESGYIGTEPRMISKEMPPPVIVPSVKVHDHNSGQNTSPSSNVEDKTAPLKSFLPEIIKQSGDSDVPLEMESFAMDPPLKRPRVVGPVLSKASQKAKACKGTLACLIPSSLQDPGLSIAAKKEEASVNVPLDSNKDEWRAPVDQDGSGRTKLNQKFGDRY